MSVVNRLICRSQAHRSNNSVASSSSTRSSDPEDWSTERRKVSSKKIRSLASLRRLTLGARFSTRSDSPASLDLKGEALAQQLSEAIRSGTLQNVEFNSTDLCNKVLLKNAEVFKAMESANALKSIRLRDVTLLAEDTARLGKIVSKNEVLEKLELENANIGGFHATAPLVSKAVHLKELRLDKSIRDDMGSLAKFNGNVFVDYAHSEASFGSWSTIEAKNVSLSENKWYYEVSVIRMQRQEFLQIGWADSQFSCKTSSDGVGDDGHSWAFDPVRLQLWHKKGSQAWGLPVKQGDVIGCMLDLDNRVIRYTMNGVNVGVAFSGFKFTGGLRPAVTAGSRFKLRINFGNRSSRFPLPTGYRFVKDWYDAERKQGVGHLLQSFQQVLATNKRLHTLQLSGNNLGSTFVSSLAESLGSSSTLQVLDLSNNRIGPEGGYALATVLLESTTLSLQQLNLNHNDLQGEFGGSACILSLATVIEKNTSLTHLLLRGNDISPSSAEAIGFALSKNRTLGTLDLSENPFAGSAFLNAVGTQGNYGLRELVLASSGVGAEDVKEVFRLIGLRSLDLSGNLITPRGASILFSSFDAENQLMITHLRLNDCGLGAGVESLASSISSECPLQVLHIARNNVKADAMTTLVKSLVTLAGANLVEIDLSGNQVNLRDATMLVENCLLQKVSLAGCGFGEQARPTLSEFFNALGSTTTLEEIDLGDNLLDETLAVTIASSLLRSGIGKVNLARNKLGSAGLSDLVEGLVLNRSLHTIDLSANEIGFDAMESLVSMLRSNMSIQDLILKDNAISEPAQDAVRQALQCAWASRAQVIFELLLERAPMSIAQRLFRTDRTKRFVWSPMAQYIAVNGLPCLMALLQWIEDSHSESLSIYNCSAPLHFHNCTFPIELPAKFSTTEVLCLDSCTGPISFGHDISCGTLNLMKCQGPIRLASGLNVSNGFFILHCPGILEVPSNVNVHADFVVKGCENLVTMHDKLSVVGDFGVAECPKVENLPEGLHVNGAIALVDLPRLGSIPRNIKQDSGQDLVLSNCQGITTLPEPLLRTPRRILLHNTGMHRQEIIRLLRVANPSIVWGIGDEELVETFENIKAAISFWGKEGGLDQSAIDSLFGRLEKSITTYYRDSVLVFLSKLRISKEFDIPEMRQSLAFRVVEALEFIADKPEARDEILMRISDSVDTCGDKVIYALNQMKIVMLGALAKGSREELQKLGLQVMRLNIVHEHVARKIKSLPQKEVDDVCVYLRFEIELREALDLPVTSQAMLFPDFVKISKKELDAAKKDALKVTEESPEFQEWLKTWPNWQRQMRVELCDSLTYEDLPPAKVDKRVSLSLTDFSGEPMTQPVALGKAGPWNFDELMLRWVETGMDFNNVEWTVDDFEANLGRLFFAGQLPQNTPDVVEGLDQQDVVVEETSTDEGMETAESSDVESDTDSDSDSEREEIFVNALGEGEEEEEEEEQGEDEFYDAESAAVARRISGRSDDSIFDMVLREHRRQSAQRLGLIPHRRTSEFPLTIRRLSQDSQEENRRASYAVGERLHRPFALSEQDDEDE